MLIAQRPHSSSFEDQTGVIRDILANPAARESSQKVAVGYDQHIEWLVHAAFGLANGVFVEALANVGDDGVAAGGYVGGGSKKKGLLVVGVFLSLSIILGIEERKATYSPPGHPSLQISHSSSPLFLLCSPISLLVIPS
jgi:hypothetical protein